MKELSLDSMPTAQPLTWSIDGINSKAEHDGYLLRELDLIARGKRLKAINVKTLDVLTPYKARDYSASLPKLNAIKCKGKEEITLESPPNQGRIDLLIGTNNPCLWLSSKYRIVKDLVAIKTALGWTVASCEATFPPWAHLSTATNSNEKDHGHFDSNCGAVRCQDQEAQALLVDVPAPPAPLDPELVQAEAEERHVFHSVLTASQPTKTEELTVLKSLRDLLEKHWEMEDFHDTGMTVEESLCIDRLRESFEVRDGKAYVDPLWKPGQPEPGLNNFGYAKHRLDSVLKKLKASEGAFDSYNSVFQTYLDSGIIEDVTDQVTAPYKEDGLYWAHFPVYRESETTPVRPVMDGAAKCLDGKSINDICFLPGPNLINDLTKVLTRFRRYDVGFMGDISKMFLKIQNPEKYRLYYRFIWVDPKDHSSYKIFQFKGHLFGNNGSPTCSMYAVQRNAEDRKDKYPRAVECVKESTIVDDHIDSVSTEKEAIQVIKDLVEIHGSIGLKIAKFASNSLKVGQNLPAGTSKGEVMVSFDKYVEETEYALDSVPKMPHVKTLGQFWNMVKDQLTYHEYQADRNAVWTKVSCLSQAHKIFDPLGFATPVLLESKLFLQELWSREAGWKDPLTQSEYDSWKSWLKNLPALQKLSFDRVLIPGTEKEVNRLQLHVFADASKEAYAAVAYLRVEYKDGRMPLVSFVQAKSRVKSKKLNRTIPKLELMGIELASRLANHCADPLKVSKEERYIWSDSKTALQWLRMDPLTLQVFCHNYCKKVKEEFPIERLRWVAGEDNPADLPTRPKSVSQLCERISLWRHGPAFLTLDSSEWPVLPALDTSSEVMQEVKKEYRLFKAPSNVFTTHDYSQKERAKVDTPPIEKAFDAAHYRSLPHMKNVFAYVLRFWNACKGIKESKAGEKRIKSRTRTPNSLPSSKELKEAEKRLIYLHQERYFSSEKEQIRAGTLPQRHILNRLGAELIAEPSGFELLRLGGRVVCGHLNQEAKHPYLLHPDDAFTSRLVQHLHGDVLKHVGGLNCLKCELNRSYWVVGSVGTLKRVLNECGECRRAFPKPTLQVMAPLHADRIPNDSKGELPTPFSSVVIDAAGPWLTKQRRGHARIKRWLLILRCTLSGAVCHEMLYDMSEDGFLSALERFRSRYVLPTTIYCDQGTNFVGGSNELTKLWKRIDQARPELQFKFSPPDSPHFNGLAERAVQAAKRALRVVLKEAVPTDEELSTFFLVVERFLNDRPIALKNPRADPRDYEALTPSHFLMKGRIGEDLAPFVVPGDVRKRFSYIRTLVTHFWKRYTLEVVPELRHINKWLSDKPDLEPGDVVVVLDGDSHSVQHRYPIGRIEEALPGPDGHARRFLVRMASTKKVMEKALNRLYLLAKGEKEAETHISVPKRYNRRKRGKKKALITIH